MVILWLLLVLEWAKGISIKTIPETQTPPSPMIGSSAVHHKESNLIYVVGGQVVETDLKTSDIYSFNLKTKQWSRILIDSEYVPSFLVFHYSYLNSHDEILVFTKNYEVYKFNLKTLGWSYDYIRGDLMKSTALPSFTYMNYNSTEYIVKFGGITTHLTNELYL